MKNTYNKKYVYFLSLDCLMEQHDFVPEELEELDGVAVMPNEKLNIGCVKDYLVSLDWCDKVPTELVDCDQIQDILYTFNDEELYTPLEEVLYDSFIKTGKRAEDAKIDALNISKALDFTLGIVAKNKRVIPTEDIKEILEMQKGLIKALGIGE